MHFRCPNCLNPIEIAPAGELAENEISCPSCHSRIALASDDTQSYSSRASVTLAGYEIREVLGEGAFGTVFKAWDQNLEREVALKIPRSANKAELAAGFLKEARAAAAVSHPNVVTVYEVGIHEGSFYIASELIRGASLAKYLQTHQLDYRQVVSIMIRLLEAAQCFHEHGIVHRDLKPSNILLDLELQPHISDFGLARKESAAEATVTLSGKLIGTPAYMSPEQARADSRAVTFKSDLYSLGVILYEMLTGLRPFKATDSRTLIHSILTDDPLPLRRIDPKIPKELEAICLKAMEREPSRRYENAAAMASDLENFISGRPVVARPVGQVRKAIKWLRRNTGTAIAASGLTLAASLILIQFLMPLRGGADASKISHRVKIACRTATPISEANFQWAFAKLDEKRGVVDSEVIRVEARQAVEVQLQPGEYMVEVVLPGYGFHQVHRTVPLGQDSASGAFANMQFDWEDGSVLLPEIYLYRFGEAVEDLLLVNGGSYSTGTVGNPFTPPWTLEILDFYLEPTEVTYEKYVRVITEPVVYTRMERPPVRDAPVIGVTWHQAAHYAEAIGRRLMTEMEWEYAATNAARTSFPWGEATAEQPSWEVTSVSAPTIDVNRQGIRNLFSNASEMTYSVLAPFPGGVMFDSNAELARFGFVYRGGPADADQLDAAGRWMGEVKHRMSTVSRNESHAQIGFRCALSRRPRFFAWPDE